MKSCLRILLNSVVQHWYSSLSADLFECLLKMFNWMQLQFFFLRISFCCNWALRLKWIIILCKIIETVYFLVNIFSYLITWHFKIKGMSLSSSMVVVFFFWLIKLRMGHVYCIYTKTSTFISWSSQVLFEWYRTVLKKWIIKFSDLWEYTKSARTWFKLQ